MPLFGQRVYSFEPEAFTTLCPSSQYGLRLFAGIFPSLLQLGFMPIILFASFKELPPRSLADVSLDHVVSTFVFSLTSR